MCCHHGMIVSDLWPSLPLHLFSPSAAQSQNKAQTTPGRWKKKKELLLWKLHTAETGTSQTADLRSKVVGYRSGHSHRPPHTLGLGRKTIYLVFQLKCICGRLGVHVRGIDVLCTRGKRLQWPFVQCFRTHTHFPGGHSVPQEAPSAHKGPEKAS